MPVDYNKVDMEDAVMTTPAWALAQARALRASGLSMSQAWARRTRAYHQVLDAVYTVWREAIETIDQEARDE